MHNWFDRAGVKYKPDEIMIIVRKFISDDKKEIHSREFFEFCRDDLERHEWAITTKRLRRAQDKAEVAGIDLGQLLSEFDTEDTGYLSSNSFRMFLEELSRHSKLTSKEIDRTIRHFSQRSSENQDRDPVSCKKVMAFFGREYGGNLVKRLQALIRDHAQDIFAAFGSRPSATNGRLSLNFVEELLGEFKVYDHFTHDQIKGILSAADVQGKGHLTAKELLDYLHIRFEPNLASNVSAKREIKAPLTVEELLRILIDRCKAKGSSVSETFRHFDSDGDGLITHSDLEEGLDKLGIFDNITHWREQIPAMAAKIDTAHHGLISLHDFFEFLGDPSYAPNIIQKMTKIFALAIERGMTYDTIFNTIDHNKTGKISVEELHKGLVDLGTFSDLKITDVMELITHLDQDRDNKISAQEFVDFFKGRVQMVAQERSKKHAERVVLKFRNYIVKVMDKGGRLEDIYNYFDLDKDGYASKDEIARGIKKLPNFQELSSDELGVLVQKMDFDHNGMISFTEFRKFTRLPSEGGNKAESKVSREDLSYTKNDSKDDDRGERRLRSDYSPRELLVRHMRRISLIDGGIAHLLAYLDDDEDGLITQTALMRLLRKEDVFETVSEKDVERMLEPMLHHGKVNVAALLRFFEGKENKENAKNIKHPEDDDCDRRTETVDDYEYSKDPEVRSLERKLRGFGRFLAKRGLDVEQLFSRNDPSNKGWIRRTDFVNALSEMGLFFIEKGKVVEEVNAGEGADPERRVQLRQLKKLKGTYMDHAERVARKFVLEGGSEAKDSDFRVRDIALQYRILLA